VVALIALFVISVKLVMPIVVAVVLILLTLIVMFGNIKIRTRPAVLMTAFAVLGGMLPGCTRFSRRTCGLELLMTARFIPVGSLGLVKGEGRGLKGGFWHLGQFLSPVNLNFFLS